MRKLIGMLFAATLLFACNAQAQVAVPKLAPLAPQINSNEFAPRAFFVTLNPAAMQWGTPSRLGGGTFKGEIKNISPGTIQTTFFDGNYGGLRLVGENVSFAAQTISLKVDPPTIQERKSQAAAIAFQIGQEWAFGLSGTSAERTLPALTLESDTVDLGLSWRVNESFFMGLSLGRQTRTNPGAGSSSRGVAKAGIAYRDGGDVQWHFEVFGIFRDEVSVTAPGPFVPGVQTTGLTAEINILGFLISLTGLSTSIDPNNEISSLIMDVGIAPNGGLAVLYHRETQSTKVGVGLEFETTTNAVSLAWLF
ncbi:MAG: hypothetical protein O7G32_12955 [SAR324 cluster bacterium]|nr:hypothetical protein [SAR324 cluster bacterium]